MHLHVATVYYVQWSPDFLNLQGKRRLARESESLRKSVVKLQYSTEGRETAFGSSYQKVQEIGISLYNIPSCLTVVIHSRYGDLYPGRKSSQWSRKKKRRG